MRMTAKLPIYAVTILKKLLPLPSIILSNVQIGRIVNVNIWIKKKKTSFDRMVRCRKDYFSTRNFCIFDIDVCRIVAYCVIYFSNCNSRLKVWIYDRWTDNLGAIIFYCYVAGPNCRTVVCTGSSASNAQNNHFLELNLFYRSVKADADYDSFTFGWRPQDTFISEKD